MLRDNMINRRSTFVLYLLFSACCSLRANSQQQPDSVLQQATLPNVIQYALRRQPLVRQSLVDEKITELQIKSKLAEWHPQVNLNYFYQHNFHVQTSVIGGNTVRL